MHQWSWPDSSEGLSDPRTGRALRFEVPDLAADPSLVFGQWLDDDRFTLVSGGLRQNGELLVCRISADRCEVEIERADMEDPLMPGGGGLGAELALSEVVFEKAEAPGLARSASVTGPAAGAHALASGRRRDRQAR